MKQAGFIYTLLGILVGLTVIFSSPAMTAGYAGADAYCLDAMAGVSHAKQWTEGK